jgi:hypothetical protein
MKINKKLLSILLSLSTFAIAAIIALMLNKFSGYQSDRAMNYLVGAFFGSIIIYFLTLLFGSQNLLKNFEVATDDTYKNVIDLGNGFGYSYSNAMGYYILHSKELLVNGKLRRNTDGVTNCFWKNQHEHYVYIAWGYDPKTVLLNLSNSYKNG